jgi:hypothetical protein
VKTTPDSYIHPNNIGFVRNAPIGYKYVQSEYPIPTGQIDAQRLPTGQHGLSRRVMDFMNRYRNLLEAELQPQTP